MLHAGTATVDGPVCQRRRPGPTVVGTGADLAKAREAAYAAVDRIELPGSHHRTDIARSAQLGEVRIP